LIPVWKGKPILPTRSAQNEMFDIDVSLFDIEDILEESFECSRSKREKSTFERCVQRGQKIIKVVVVDTGDHFVITHVGAITASKKKLQQLKRR